MRFRRAMGLLAFALLTAAQTSCLRDPAPVVMDVGIGKGLNGCLSRFDVTIRNYFNGRASDGEVSRLFDCATESFRLFMRHTRGEKTGEYLPSELRAFFTKYFLGDRRISEGLLKEAMILKQAILGGSEHALTQAELSVTIDLLNLLKAEALKIRQYMPIERQHFNDLRGKELQGGLQAIDQGGVVLGGFLNRAVRPYYLANLSNLLLELQQVMESGQEGRGPRILRDNLEVFGAMKHLMFGGDDHSIAPGDWAKIASIGSRWYSMYLRISNLDARRFQNWRDREGEAESWFHGEALNDFARFGEAGRDLLLESMTYHPDHLVSFRDVHRLVDTLTEPPRSDWEAFNRQEAWRPFDTEMAGYLKSSMIYLVQHALGGYETNPTGRDAPGFTVPLIQRVWGEFASWHTQQRYLEKVYQTLGGDGSFDKPGYRREEILAVPEADFRSYNLFERLGVPVQSLRVAVFDMREVIKRFRPLFSGKETKIYFPDRGDDPAGVLYSYSNLSTMNWIRSFSRLVLQGYVKSRDVERARAYGGLTEDELDRLYWDFRSFGQKLGFLDPSTTMSGIRRFREANLFTSVANGDNFLSLDEGMELFAFLMSAGKISNQLHSDIAKSCPVGPKDEFGNYEIESSCYRKRFAERLGTREWAQMPGMVRYFQKLTPVQKEQFMVTLQSACGKGGQGQLIDHFSSEIIVMVPHYVESVFARFDADHSSTITVNEALNAFPVFHKVLLEHPAVREAKRTSIEDLQAIFTFLLKEGRTPTGPEFLYWRYWESWEGKVHADRGIILKIFASLASI